MTIASSLDLRRLRPTRRAAPQTWAALALAAVALAACETVPPPPPPPPPAPTGPAPFSAADFAWSAQKGTNSIVGQVVYRPRGGPAWSCAGLSVVLTPQTRYSRERTLKLYGSDIEAVQSAATVRSRTVANPAPVEYSQFVRFEKCDAQSNFAFRDLPDGAYFIIAPVHPPQAGGEEVAVMDRVEVYRGMALRLTMPRAGAAAAPAQRRPARQKGNAP